MSHKPLVLVADDEEAIARMLCRALEGQFSPLMALGGVEAMALIDRTPNLAAIITDQNMPGAHGVEVLQHASRVQPGAGRVIITASSNLSDLRDAINVAHAHRFLCKPVSLVHVVEAVRDAAHLAGLEDHNRRLVSELKDKNELLTRALGQVQEHERRLEREVDERTRELRVAMTELEQMALRDGLTGLYNHRYFQEALAHELARGARYGHTVGLVFLDVDHFKVFNDTHGHPKGDELLRQVGRILLNNGELPDVKFRGRTSDIAARYGGEEFVVILPQTPREGTILRAERLRESVANHRFDGADKQPLGRITCSVGVASFPDDGTSQVDLIHAADQAMFRAKRSGRNRVVVAGADAPSALPM